MKFSFSALAMFLGRLVAVISLTCGDDGLRRSVFPGPHSTYARVLVYCLTNRKTLIPTSLGVENARLAFFYSSARRRENAAWRDV